MKLSQAKEYLPFVQAAAEGKTIQYRSDVSGKWVDLEPENTFGINRYGLNGYDNEIDGELRIKPQPKLRAWGEYEVPVGVLIKANWWTSGVAMIVSRGTDMFTITGNAEQTGVTREDALVDYKYSPDHGKTWLPCGVMEDGQ